jgi:hypothetical protein
VGRNGLFSYHFRIQSHRRIQVKILGKAIWNNCLFRSPKCIMIQNCVQSDIAHTIIFTANSSSHTRQRLLHRGRHWCIGHCQHRQLHLRDPTHRSTGVSPFECQENHAAAGHDVKCDKIDLIEFLARRQKKHGSIAPPRYLLRLFYGTYMAQAPLRHV